LSEYFSDLALANIPQFKDANDEEIAVAIICCARKLCRIETLGPCMLEEMTRQNLNSEIIRRCIDQLMVLHDPSFKKGVV